MKNMPLEKYKNMDIKNGQWLRFLSFFLMWHV